MPDFQPLDFGATPRFAGDSTFLRLPRIDDPAAIDIALFGIPWDAGTTNRPGARHGPREIRAQSAMIRRIHPTSGTAPYALCRVADLGDAPANPMDLAGALESVEAFVARIVAAGAAPLAAGGDHLSSLPVLRALGGEAPVGLVHFDAHSDTADSYFGGSRYTHGTPFRRAVEDGVVDPTRTIQIGLRGSQNDAGDLDFARGAGMRLCPIEEVMDAGVDAIAAEARRVAGGGPVYISFDVDALDPAFAPGTGTPEVGGLTTHQAQRIIRGLAGLDIVGGDVVEVSPPFDHAGITALAAANMLFEILCVMAPAIAARPAVAGRPRG